MIARISTIRFQLDLEAIDNRLIHQMNIKTTFMNGDIKRKCIIIGFTIGNKEHDKCKLG